mgnify:CR=1 FL=1
MSKIEGWSTSDAATAFQQGWVLCDVYDLTKKALSFKILPAKFSTPRSNSTNTTRYVIARASQGDDLARRAIAYITQGKK